jgi:nucleotide-binding universal stress UspA family protein
LNGRLVALFVNDPLLVAAAAAASDRRGFASTTLKELQRFVEHSSGAFTASTVCMTVAGNPAQEIHKAVRQLDCEMVVMGTRGLSGAGRLFIGSTTDHVLRHAAVPVLAVPVSGRGRSSVSQPRAWPRRVLAPVDVEHATADDVAAAARFAAEFGASLRLVTVVSPTHAPRWFRADSAESDRARLAAARTTLAKLAKAISSLVKADTLTLSGEPAQQILAAAQDYRADLIAMTLRKRHGLFGARQGSTTYRVLCTAYTPVLAFPPRMRRRS